MAGPRPPTRGQKIAKPKRKVHHDIVPQASKEVTLGHLLRDLASRLPAYLLTRQCLPLILLAPLSIAIPSLVAPFGKTIQTVRASSNLQSPKYTEPLSRNYTPVIISLGLALSITCVTCVLSSSSHRCRLWQGILAIQDVKYARVTRYPPLSLVIKMYDFACCISHVLYAGVPRVKIAIRLSLTHCTEDVVTRYKQRQESRHNEQPMTSVPIESHAVVLDNEHPVTGQTSSQNSTVTPESWVQVSPGTQTSPTVLPTSGSHTTRRKSTSDGEAQVDTRNPTSQADKHALIVPALPKTSGGQIRRRKSVNDKGVLFETRQILRADLEHLASSRSQHMKQVSINANLELSSSSSISLADRPASGKPQQLATSLGLLGRGEYFVVHHMTSSDGTFAQKSLCMKFVKNELARREPEKRDNPGVYVRNLDHVKKAFGHEIEAMKHISRHSHIHLPKLIRTGGTDSEHTKFMDYTPVGYQTLDGFLRSCDDVNGPISLKEDLMGHMSCLSNVMAHLHNDCIIYHGDIKLENIVLACGRLMLIDYGASHILNTPYDTIKDSRNMFHTKEFCAPECLAHRDCGLPADIFACGVVYLLAFTVLCRGSIDELIRYRDSQSRTGKDPLHGSKFFSKKISWIRNSFIPSLDYQNISSMCTKPDFDHARDMISKMLSEKAKDRPTAAQIHFGPSFTLKARYCEASCVRGGSDDVPASPRTSRFVSSLPHIKEPTPTPSEVGGHLPSDSATLVATTYTGQAIPKLTHQSSSSFVAASSPLLPAVDFAFKSTLDQFGPSLPLKLPAVLEAQKLVTEWSHLSLHNDATDQEDPGLDKIRELPYMTGHRPHTSEATVKVALDTVTCGVPDASGQDASATQAIHRSNLDSALAVPEEPISPTNREKRFSVHGQICKVEYLGEPDYPRLRRQCTMS